MGEFTSQLFRNLANAADITYNKELSDDTPVFSDSRGKTIFTNADARRMDQMKTAIIRLLLLRACNFMRMMQQDAITDEAQRYARAEFSFELRTTNIMHKDWPEEKFKPLGGGAATRPAASFSDVVDGQADAEIENILQNFVQDVTYTDRITGETKTQTRLMFNCPPPPR